MRGRGGRNVFSSLRSLLFISSLDEPVDWERNRGRRRSQRRRRGGGHSSQEQLLPPLLSPYISLSIVSCVELMSRRTDARRSPAALISEAKFTLILRRQQLSCCLPSTLYCYFRSFCSQDAIFKSNDCLPPPPHTHTHEHIHTQLYSIVEDSEN